MPQKVSSPTLTPAVILSPLARFVRMAVQLLIALAAAVPTILNTPGVAGNAQIAKYVGIVAGYIILVNAVINSLEHFGVIKVMGGKPVAQSVGGTLAIAGTINVTPPLPVPELPVE